MTISLTAEAAMTTAATMRAVVQDRYGSSEVLRAGRVARPVIADDQVLLHVSAAGLDRGTEHLMTGKPYVARLFVGLRKPKNPIPGTDMAGVVESLLQGPAAECPSSADQHRAPSRRGRGVASRVTVHPAGHDSIILNIYLIK